jgi:hypothetical protein
VGRANQALERATALALGTLALAVAGCGGSSATTTTTPARPQPNATTSGPTTAATPSDKLVGSWLGPAPNSGAEGCATSKITYTFDAADNWTGQLLYESTCGGGGNFTVGGTYTFDGQALELRWTRCPESCPPDTTVTLTFVGGDAFSMSGVDGTYHRQ